MRVGSKPLTSDQKQMNQNNVAKFAGAFLNRSDVIPIVEKSLSCETMLLAGAKAESQVTAITIIIFQKIIVLTYLCTIFVILDWLCIQQSLIYHDFH